MSALLERRPQPGERTNLHSAKDRAIGSITNQTQRKIHEILYRLTTPYQIQERASRYYDQSMKPGEILSKIVELEENIARAVHHVMIPTVATEELAEVSIVQAFDLKDYGMASVVDVFVHNSVINKVAQQTITTPDQHGEPLFKTAYYTLNGIPPVRTPGGDWQLHFTETAYTANKGQKIIIDEETHLLMCPGMEPFHSLVLAKT